MNLKSRERQPSLLLASALSVVPGLGHIYIGKTKRGMAILAITIAQAAIIAIAGMIGFWFWLVLIWLWSMADATKLAKGHYSSLAIPTIAIALLNLLLGWQMSDIGTQIRQVDVTSGLANARNLASALVQPDLLQTDELQTADAEWAWLRPAQTPHAKKTDKTKPLLHLAQQSGRVLATGTGFAPNAEGAIFLHAGGERQLAQFNTNGQGEFSAAFKNPASIPGLYWVQAQVQMSLPPIQWKMSETLSTSLKRMLETVFLAFIGTAISLLISLPLSFLAARNLASQIPGGWGLYTITRSAFNILRSIEVLIIAVIMAIIVGIGPLAGALALSIHGIGALGKLYSEAIESVEHGPIEAVMSTGANWFQVVRFGAVPQVVPQFISFTMYRWDINVRMATVIGLVGGGGIGNLLYSYINSLQWEKAATAIWLIAVVVMLMDYASAVIREQVT